MLFLINYYNPADPTDVDHHELAFYANQQNIGGSIIGLHFDPRAEKRDVVKDPLWRGAGLINDVPRLGYVEEPSKSDAGCLLSVFEIIYVGF